MNIKINRKFWKNKRVFITGHTGFKGSWLSIFLTHLGAEVTGYSLKPNTTKIPLRIITFIGLAASLLSFMISIIFLFRKIFNWDSFDVGVAPLIIGLFMIASIQIFLLGFIGEYVMNILQQTRNSPLVIEKKKN